MYEDFLKEEFCTIRIFEAMWVERTNTSLQHSLVLLQWNQGNQFSGDMYLLQNQITCPQITRFKRSREVGSRCRLLRYIGARKYHVTKFCILKLEARFSANILMNMNFKIIGTMQDENSKPLSLSTFSNLQWGVVTQFLGHPNNVGTYLFSNIVRIRYKIKAIMYFLIDQARLKI